MVKNTKGGSSHKKMARKNEDLNKSIKVNLDVNFKGDNMIVFIEKNLGNCFLGRLLYFNGPNNFDEELKIMHQRGKKGKSNFDHSASKIALVSIISGLTLSTKCVAIVEEFLEIDHINAYLANNLISQEIYDKLNMKFSTSSKNENDDETDLGFEFDRNKEIDDDENQPKKVKFKQETEVPVNKQTIDNKESDEESSEESEQGKRVKWSNEGKGTKGGKGGKGVKDSKPVNTTVFSRIKINQNEEDSGWSFWGNDHEKNEENKKVESKNLNIEEI